MDERPSFDELSRQLEQIIHRQKEFQSEINALQKALDNLKPPVSTTKIEEVNTIPNVITPPVPLTDSEKVVVTAHGPVFTTPKNLQAFDKQAKAEAAAVKAKKVKTPLEEFIGTNLLNKIGIAILVIGVGIGAEYAIDNGWIGPEMRIVLGYLCGIILLGIAIRLKPKYENFSAVLLSGGMAILYFITFAAYDFYHLFGSAIAFALMVIFTGFTVFAALQYNLQVIAIIGLVGAYGVPFLLSNGSGQVTVLFSYMTIINAGILILGFKKYWKQLFYIAFSFTWLIFGVWYLDKYQVDEHLWIALTFSTLFFITFYGTVLAYKLIRGESLTKWDITMVLLNSFIYYGFGYFAIEAHEHGDIYLGLFTVFNAALHFLVCLIIFKSQAQTRAIFLFAAGLVLVFLTLAVPVQLEGNWVTMIWAAEAALLFWLGRTKNLPGYEKLSYPLIVLAAGSLVHDWTLFYAQSYYYTMPGYIHIHSFLNIQLFTSLFVCAALGWIVKVQFDKNYSSPLAVGGMGDAMLRKGLPAMMLLLLYGSFFHEVNTYWQQRSADSQLPSHDYGGMPILDEDVLKFGTIWILNYSAIFILVLSLINLFRIKNKTVGFIGVGMASMVIFAIITSGFYNASELRASYLDQTDATYYYRSAGHLLIRYVCIVLVAALLYINYRAARIFEFPLQIRQAINVFFHFVILSILSSELVSGLALTRIENTDKLALTILWGTYALSLIIYGLIKDLKYIRITAIVLFGVTLIKLFFYDMSSLSTIAKTIVMIILGALLLLASFLYNKFKKQADEKIV